VTTLTSLPRSASRFVAQATQQSAIVIAAYLATLVLNYVFGVALSWFFSPAEFGVLGVAQALLLLLALVVSSGFAWTAHYDVAASGVNDSSRRRFRGALLANTLLGAALAAGLWLAYQSGWLPLGSPYQAIVPLVGLTTILLAARAVVNGVVRGLYHYGPLGLNLAGEVVVKVGAGLLLAALGAGVAGVMAGFALGATAALLHSLWVVRPAHLWRGKGWYEGGLVKATVPLFIGMLGSAIILNLDVLGLKLLAPPGVADQQAGVYQAAVILARTPVFIAQALVLVLFSHVAGAYETNGEAAGYWQAAVRAWTRLLLPIAVALAVAPQAALQLFFSEDYHAAEEALRVAALGSGLLALVTLLSGVALAGEDRRGPATAAAVGVTVQVVVLVLAVPLYGPLGAALSLLAASGAALVILLLALRRPMSDARRGNSAAWKVIVGLVRTVLPLLAMALPLWLLPNGDRVTAGLKLGVAGVAYAAALIALRSPALLHLEARREAGDDKSPQPLLWLVDVFLGG
jgi:O-antigen/teichoic acid export membrane protein